MSNKQDLEKGKYVYVSDGKGGITKKLREEPDKITDERKYAYISDRKGGLIKKPIESSNEFSSGSAEQATMNKIEEQRNMSERPMINKQTIEKQSGILMDPNGNLHKVYHTNTNGSAEDSVIAEAKLSKLANKFVKLYIEKLVDCGTYYIVYVTDEFGNLLEDNPVCLDIKTGDILGDIPDGGFSGIKIEVPEKYKHCKRKILDRLSEIIERDGSAKYLHYDPVTYITKLYMYSKIDVTPSDLFALSNRLVHIEANYEKTKLKQWKDEYNKDVVRYELSNIMTEKKFLDMSLNEKLADSENYYLMPDEVTNYINSTEELLQMAMKILEGQRIDGERLKSLIAELGRKEAIALESARNTKDILINNAKVEDKVKQCIHNTRVEYNFIIGKSDALSERMDRLKRKMDEAKSGQMAMTSSGKTYTVKPKKQGLFSSLKTWEK